MKKPPFDIDRFMAILAAEYRSWNAPVITLIANRGGSPFEILISTLLSLRTKDAVTGQAAARLLAVAATPGTMIALDEARLRELIYPVGFYATKARRILAISRILLEKFDGRVPDTIEALTQLPGVGRKTANLVLVEGFGKEAICVDTHVHRISNRIGYVRTKSPDKTEAALRRKLPRRHWVRYNEILVAFGQTICRPVSPLCSQCPAAALCPSIGVAKSR